MKQAPHTRLRTYAWSTLVFVLGVILWGAYVRISHSGDGCGRHWPDCHGALIPTAKTNATWIEFTHRLTSGLSFLLVWGQVMWARALSGARAWVSRFSLAAGVLMITEALLGAGLVLFELVARNASLARAFWMSAHVLNTFFLLGCLVAALYQLHTFPRATKQHAGYQVTVFQWALLALVALLAMTGAVAALGDTVFPSSSLAAGLRQDFDPRGPALVRLRALHPITAVIVSVVVLVWARMQLLAGRATHGGWHWPLLVMFTTVVQLGLGALNLGLLAPGYMQLIHLFAADVVWMVLVVAILKASTVVVPHAEFEASARVEASGRGDGVDGRGGIQRFDHA